MRSQLFDVTGDKHECYAKEVRKALELILDDFRDLRLHNRLAILCPTGSSFKPRSASQKEPKDPGSLIRARECGHRIRRFDRQLTTRGRDRMAHS